MKPGIYPGLPMAEYLAIDALSATPARTLLDECPAAGWFASKLNAERPRDESDGMDLGTVAHSVLLEDSTECCVVIDPKDYPTKSNGNIPKGWTNNEIRAARDAARAAGKSPMFKSDFDNVMAMVGQARAFIKSLREAEPAVYQAFMPNGGDSEVTMVWDEGGTLCKLRCDCVANDYSIVTDYKTTAGSASPSKWGRTHMIGSGLYFNAAWYRRGIAALTGITPDYLFLVQENAAPYLCSLQGMDAETIALGDEKVAAALKQWRRCVTENAWPGYPARVCYPELPPWERLQWDSRLQVTGDGIDYGSQA